MLSGVVVRHHFLRVIKLHAVERDIPDRLSIRLIGHVSMSMAASES